MRNWHAPTTMDDRIPPATCGGSYFLLNKNGTVRISSPVPVDLWFTSTAQPHVPWSLWYTRVFKKHALIIVLAVAFLAHGYTDFFWQMPLGGMMGGLGRCINVATASIMLLGSRICL